MAKKLSTEERIKLLVKNHKDFIMSITLGFANQLHSLMNLREKELKNNAPQGLGGRGGPL